MQLTAVAVALIVLKPGAGVAHFVFHWHRQAVDAQRGIFAVQLGTGVMAQYRSAQQEAVAECRRIGGKPQIVMGEVVARRILKRQLDVV